MRRLFFLLFIFSSLVSYGQFTDFGKQISISGFVGDAITGDGVLASVEILNAKDSSSIGKGQTREFNPALPFLKAGGFSIMLPKQDRGKYLLKCSAVGYKTKIAQFNIASKSQITANIKDVYLMPEVKMLDEVTVTTSKLKMVMDGDTVVYNADAFMLPEGSKLDALVRRLPGVQVSSGGIITYNGKFVESLLVNGKDFFQGAALQALQNLPAYSVKKVKVYEEAKADIMAADDKRIVMDVNMKREYINQWMGDITLGAGTHEKHFAKAMGLRISNISKTLLYASSNNVGQGLMPSIEQGWERVGPVINNDNIQRAGLSYTYQRGMINANRFSTNNEVAYTRSDIDTHTSTEQFVSNGNNYGRTFRNNNSKYLELSSSNSMRLYFEGLSNLTADLKAHYAHRNSSSEQLSALFYSDPLNISNLRKDVFENTRYDQIMLNRQKVMNSITDNQLGIDFDGTYFFQFLGQNSMFMFKSGYERSDNKAFALNEYLVAANNILDRQNQYTKTPNHNFMADGLLNMTYHSKFASLSPFYKFTFRSNSTDNIMYRLDKLDVADMNSAWDMLPSHTEAMEQVISEGNSYIYSEHDYLHSIGVNLSKMKDFKNASMTVRLNLPLNWQIKQLDYDFIGAGKIATRSSKPRQNDIIFDPTLRFNLSIRKVRMDMNLDIEQQTSTPSMLSMVEYNYDNNPLFVRIGNPNLKNQKTRTIRAGLNKRYRAMNYIMFNGAYSNMLDAIAQGQTIDPVTGIITSMPTNIDGNWNASGGIIINWGFDNQQRFYLNNSINYSFSNSVDMMNTTGASALNTVKNHVVKDVLKFNMDVLPSRLTLTLKGDMQWHRACSDMSTFREINAWDFGAGITALAQLPLRMELETAMMQRSRRGYYDSQMNTDELVWNASLKRSFGSLLVAIEGYDILQQLSNRTYIINAQGRTETFTSVVPAFAMIKLTYSFKSK